jgi:undecaprenyl-diphosphatase
MNPIDGLDSGTDYFFHFQRGLGPWKEVLTPVMKAANLLGGMPAQALLALAIFGLLLYLGRPRQAGILGVIVFLAVGLGEGLKWLVGANRPPDAEKFLGSEMSPSFPNVSALLTSLLLLILAIIVSTIVQRPFLRYLIDGVCLLLVLLIGASQLYLGLHFLTDLLAGWTAGVLLALVWLQFAIGNW